MQKTVFMERLPKIGAKLLLIYHEYATGGGFWELLDAPSSVGDKMDPNLVHYKGWRGTYNGGSITAYGLREVLKVRLASKDHDSNYPMYAVTVGPDISPRP